MARVLAFFVRRLAAALLTVWLMTLVVWTVFALLPADPTRFILIEQAPSAARRAYARQILGLDRPLPVQYAKWAWSALHGDLGTSWATASSNVPADEKIHIGPMLTERAAVTGSLVLGGFAALVFAAIPLGLFLATRPDSIVDRFATTSAIEVIATPPLVVGLLLQTFVANTWRLLPATGYCPLRGSNLADIQRNQLVGVPACGGPRDWATHLVLPWIVFALFFLALYMRMTRTFVLEVLDEPFVQTARAKGASEPRILRAHVLRNALVPLVTMLAMDLGTAIGVAIYVETVFGLSGLGRAMLSALPTNSGLDRPLLTGLVVFTTLIVVGLNLLADLVYRVRDGVGLPAAIPCAAARSGTSPVGG